MDHSEKNLQDENKKRYFTGYAQKYPFPGNFNVNYRTNRV